MIGPPARDGEPGHASSVQPTPADAPDVPPDPDRLDPLAPLDEVEIVTAYLSGTLRQRRTGVGWRGLSDLPEPATTPTVAVTEVEFGASRALHERYSIDAVPTTVVADARGVAVATFLGPMTATERWAAVAEAREPGSTPGGGSCRRPEDSTP